MPDYVYTDHYTMTKLADEFRRILGRSESMRWPEDFISAANEVQNYFGTDYIEGLSVSEYVNSTLTSIRAYGFACNEVVRKFAFTACTSIGSMAFASCSSLTDVFFPSCTLIGSSAFLRCSSLSSVSFPVCRTIESYAFRSCSSLTIVNFPACVIVRRYAFDSCFSLISANFPVGNAFESYAFAHCSALTTVNAPSCSTIGSYAFRDCSTLASVYLLGSSYCSLLAVNAFVNTPLSTSAYTGSFGSLFVPSSMIDTYKTMTNWSAYADRFVGI